MNPARFAVLPRFIAAVLAVASLTALTGCFGDDDSSSSTGGDSKAGELPADVPSSVTVRYPSKWHSLDPDQAINTHSQNVLHLIGGNLYELRGEEVVPGLAESHTVSDDERSWTFKLQPDLKFSDGAPLTSADVKSSLDRAMTDKKNAFAGYFAPFKSVDAPDPATVVINLKQPYPSLLSMVTLPAMMVFPDGATKEAESFFKKPISAGPYKLDSLNNAGEATFAINESYWGPKPIVPTVKFAIVEDFNTTFAQLRSGQIDISIDFPPSMRKQLENTPGIETHFVPLYGFADLDMWNGRPPLDDANVRKAISAAMDREQINEVVWGGEMDMYAGFWPPTMDGYDSGIPIEQDITGAKELLNGTDCENGCELKLQYADAYSFADQAAAIIKENLAEIGIEVSLSKVDLGTWSEDHTSGDYELAIGGLVSSINVPDLLLSYSFPQPGGGGFNANFSDWRSKRGEETALRALRVSGEEREQVLAELNEIFVEEMPYATFVPYSLLTGQRVASSIVSFSPSSLVEIAREGEES